MLEELGAVQHAVEFRLIDKESSRGRPLAAARRRVVKEVEKRVFGSRSSRALTSDVLPAPEGAETTTSRPGAAWGECLSLAAVMPNSFDVLYLFPHLLDQHFESPR